MILALALLVAGQDAPELPPSKEVAPLYRLALRHGFLRVTTRRLLADPSKVKRTASVDTPLAVPAGEALLVAGDVTAPLTLGEDAFVEIGGGLAADLAGATGAAAVVRGDVAAAAKITLRGGEFVLGGRIDGLIVQQAACDLLFAGKRPDPDHITRAAGGSIVLPDAVTAEDENLWMKQHPALRLVGRAPERGECRPVGEKGSVLLLPAQGAPLLRAMAALHARAPTLSAMLGDARLQKTLGAIKEEPDGGRRSRSPGVAAVAWFSALKADVTVRERLGLTVIEGDLPAGRVVRLGNQDGAAGNLVVVAGSVAGTLDLGGDRGASAFVGGDVTGVLSLGVDQRVVVAGAIAKGATVQFGAGTTLVVHGAVEEDAIRDALRKCGGASCVVERAARPGRLRAGASVFSGIEGR
jgi:hypothetical protein